MVNELYRQTVHLLIGCVSALAAYLLPKAVFLWLFGLIFLVSIGALLFFKQELKSLFQLFEREHAAFKGKGAIFFIFGIWVAAALFYEQAPLAILVLAVPDALATIVGTRVLSPKLPYNHRKSYAGTAAFFLSASIVLSFQYQELAVFFIAFFLTAIESFDYREIPFLDDNMVIPVVCAYLLSFV